MFDEWNLAVDDDEFITIIVLDAFIHPEDDQSDCFLYLKQLFVLQIKLIEMKKTQFYRESKNLNTFYLMRNKRIKDLI